MTAMTRSRLALLTTAISAILMLSACQPANDQVTPIDETTTDNATVDPHAGHDMSHSAMPTEEIRNGTKQGMAHKVPMTPMHQEYNDAMTRMHNEMMTAASYNDPDSAFAQGMLGHHLGAIDMAQTQLKYGKDKEMRALAQQIIAAQETEVSQMQKWLNSHPDVPAPMADTSAMQRDYTQGMTVMHDEMMLGIADPEPDMAFARGMLPHHKGAVSMAEVQLQYGKDPEMLQLAQEIINAQQPEIELMQNWIKANRR